jgi:SlyX protein
MPEPKQRITELEIMLMQQESTLESLSDTLYQQQRTIQMLEQRIEKLDKRISSLHTSAVTNEANETPPPHY